jgi:hypothetical protein
MVGYEISRSNKLEIGIDYRLNKLLFDRIRNVFWLSVSWYLRI